MWGASVASGAPAFVTFTQADLDAVMGTWSSEVSLDLLGISPRPYQTDLFVATQPDTSPVLDTDYASLTIPTLAALNGAYQRFRNAVLLAKWNTVAVCNPAPSGSLTAGDIACSSDGLVDRISCLGAAFPDVTLLSEVKMQIIAISGPPAALITGWGYGGALTVGPAPSGWLSGALPISYATTPSVGQITTHATTFYDATMNPYVPFIGFQAGFGEVSAQVRFSYTWKTVSPTPPTPPAVPTPPVDFPTPPAPDACDLAGICGSIAKLAAKLEAMDARIQHTNAALVPPAVIADTPPVLPIPSDHITPPGTPDVPNDPIPKPLDAIGAVVQITTIPPGLASYGADPLYWPSLAHIIPITAQGPMAGIRIERNPQVILPIPAQVISLAWDPQPGVVGQVQFLRAPK
jgi:hypothetical protein